MKCISILLFITIFGGSWRLSRPTCVLESDFGFILNCAFKKSGLFRVRNLGGVKAHIGLGFSVGDELGFKESISNVEMNRRRSTSGTKLQAQIIQAQQDAARSRNTILVRKPTSPTMELSLKPTNTSPTTLQISMKKSNIVPLFKPIPSAPERPSTSSNSPKMANPSPAVMGTNLPAVNKLTSSNNHNVMTIVAVPKLSMSPQAISDKIGTNTFALRTLPTKNHELLFQESSNSLNTLLKTNNVTEEDIEAALWKRQLILNKMQARTSTTYRPITPTHAKSEGKVMNAPKEYYPVGYDKNFDDNFASRVELPETSFYCGDQKHFPGLYADEDLGCMVFHVCALTDDGLIMKSFLCPESTLFDQTVLKCNWWFYVDDCKNSKKLYDSNIPISKSYQLMKALTFFSAYKKEVPTTQKTIAKD